ncbi:MAG: HAMP domain-containing histidine kinase [Ruminococcaceae bacterium]|nr:HAMP domain-containing histidine kinase [Oscillospiraceae bacterium]
MKKSKDKRKDRLSRVSLTLMFSLVIFIILFIAIGLTIGIIYLLVWLEAIPTYEGDAFEITPLLLYVTFISLLIGFGISMLLVRFPLKPFNKIISLMNRLASGDFKARLDFGKVARTIPALDEVTESFNKMAIELENTEMLRTDFINNFSHEFKTPIVSIAGFAKLLKNGNLTESQKSEYIGIIEEESMRLSDMATKVLNLTKIENQTILSEVNQFNLSEQIRHCVLLLESKWVNKNIEFDLDFPEIYTVANEEMLKQVWINILDNAIKFSNDCSTVYIFMEEKEKGIIVKVTNEGIVIPKEEQANIFRKFYQTDKSHASQGNGVGLAIVKKIVDLHDGKLFVESENGFTSFTVALKKEYTEK